MYRWGYINKDSECFEDEKFFFSENACPLATAEGTNFYGKEGTLWIGPLHSFVLVRPFFPPPAVTETTYWAQVADLRQFLSPRPPVINSLC